MTFLLLLTGGVFAVAFLVLAFVSHFEREFVARGRAALFAVVLPLPYLLTAWFDAPLRDILGWTLLVATAAFGVSLVLPGRRPRIPAVAAGARIDERTIMFSRAALEPGGGRFETYYELHPEHRPADDRFRAKPGLMSERSVKYEPLSFAAAAASFAAVEHLTSLTEGDVADVRRDIAPDHATRFLKGWSHKLGAVACGMTATRPEHYYSVKGRGPRWGETIEPEHRWAVAIAVEMDHRQMASAPDGPTIMESAQQYLDGGAIAVQMAEAIRRLGWPAEAHIDANYKVICPLVARDAGLGEIGRMGLLMTPHLGPRVRLVVVTTDLPLVADRAADEPSVLDFCAICEKCADVCPSEAIPRGPRAEADGRRRWRIDQDACFAYWCSVGTDCGQCVKVCPYSHPDSAVHAVVRSGLRRNGWTRRVALAMDDLLYGRRPTTLSPPRWLRG